MQEVRVLMRLFLKNYLSKSLRRIRKVTSFTAKMDKQVSDILEELYQHFLDIGS